MKNDRKGSENVCCSFGYMFVPSEFFPVIKSMRTKEEKKYEIDR